MTDKPIIFAGAMVRSLLKEARDPGTGKTCTRRVLKNAPEQAVDCMIENDWIMWRVGNPRDGYRKVGDTPMPYVLGDRLYVRETFRQAYPAAEYSLGMVYRADKPRSRGMDEYSDRHRWKPAIHMPRWASRLTLIVTDVKVERVQDISEEDALAEGIETEAFDMAPAAKRYGTDGWFIGWPMGVNEPSVSVDAAQVGRESFRSLWDSLNAKPRPRYATVDGKKQIVAYESFPWEEGTRTETHRGKPHYIVGNPWVAAVSFSVHHCNIDRMEKAA